MSEEDSGTVPDKPAAGSDRAETVVQWAVEWFWRGRALSERRASFVPATEHAQLLARRARVSADVANVVQTSEPLKPPHEAIASELYRQSAYWAARALSEYSSGAAPPSAAPDWASLDEAVFAPPEDGLPSARAVRELVSGSAFTHFADLPREEQRRARLSLQALSQALLAQFDARNETLRALRMQRRQRLAGLAGALLALVGLALWAQAAHLEHTELAAGKPWRTSSIYSAGCVSPEQLCAANAGWFFHTSVTDPSSWIEFDLQGVQQVSSLRVENREDCCQERAVPLAVEVSLDQKTWRQVARRDAEFTTWKPSFAPVWVRWVRLRVLKLGALHLHQVRIYP